jgi:hypothetical protein
VHLANVQQRQRAVEAAGENDADGEVGVEPNADAVFQCGSHLPHGLFDVGDRLVVVSHGQQVDIRGDDWILGWAPPSVMARRYFMDPPADGHERLEF